MKIQLLNGTQLSYVGLSEFVGLISSQLNQNPFRVSLTQNEENQFMKIIEVCNTLSISKPTLNSWVDKGVLSRIKIQSRVYFDRKEVMSLLDNKKV